jgi:hypothetical protein
VVQDLRATCILNLILGGLPFWSCLQVHMNSLKGTFLPGQLNLEDLAEWTNWASRNTGAMISMS